MAIALESASIRPAAWSHIGPDMPSLFGTPGRPNYAWPLTLVYRHPIEAAVAILVAQAVVRSFL